MDQLEDFRKLVRQWYGNLPINVLVLNKNLQKLIIEFEKICEQEIQVAISNRAEWQQEKCL
jgi:hypothetical protein